MLGLHLLLLLNVGVQASTTKEPVILEGPSNRTVVEGSSVTLHCTTLKAQGVRVLWQKDGRSLHGQGSSTWRQLESGALLLDRVGTEDSGAYRCIARNAHGVAFSDPAQLVVHGQSVLIHLCIRPHYSSY